MRKNIQLDTGIEEFSLGGGELRFNPGDPNLYARFLDTGEKNKALERSLVEKAAACDGENAPEELIRLMRQADTVMKQHLNVVFGEGNDFEQLLRGVNLLAVATNGQRVITNLFDALEPILVQGAQRCAGEKTQAAVAKAKARRASQ